MIPISVARVTARAAATVGGPGARAQRRFSGTAGLRGIVA